MTKANNWQPKPKQIAIVLELTNYENPGNITEICEKQGITRTTYYEWMKDDNFVAYLSQSRERVLKSVASRVDSALLRQATQKEEVPAMRLFYERTGEIKQENKDMVVKVIVEGNIPRPNGSKI